MLTNKVTPSTASLNQTSSSKSPDRSVGRLSNYGANRSTISLTEGQVIKGEVTDLRNKEVTVTLEDNTKVTATLDNGTSLSIGQPAAFKVVSISSQGIVLEALPNNYSLSENVTIQKALEEAGLPKTDRNQVIVHELLNNQMSINKQSIQLLLQQSLQHKTISISTLVLMNKLSIPLTEQNATQFENYRNFEHRLVKEIDQMADSLPKLLDQLSVSNSSSALAEFGNHLLALIQGNEMAAPPGSLSNPTIIFSNPEDVPELINILGDFTLDTEQKEQLLSGTLPLRTLAQTIQSSMQMANEIDLRNLLASQLPDQAETPLTAAQQAASGVASDTSNEMQLEIPKVMDEFENPVIQNVLEQFTALQKENGELASFLPLADREALAASLKSFPLSPQLKDRILTGEVPIKELLSVIKNVLSFTDADSVKHLFQTKEFQTILKENLIQNWTLTPAALLKEHAVDEFYEKMYHQLSELENLMQTAVTGSDSAALSNQAGQMKDNIDFMKTLNDLFPYVQLPLKLKDSNIHSDLYVYTKKNELKNHPENIRVLLHLDMEYLGPLDVHLSLTNRQVVSKFYLSDEDTRALIEAHAPQLQDALMKKGYTMSYETFQRQKDVDIVEDFIEKDSPSTSLKRYTFDIRA